MARMARLVSALAALVPVLLASTPASAAPRYVDRGITLPRLVFAGDVGLGFAHVSPRGTNADITGFGLNLEGALGITNSIELGLRTGVRMGPDAKIVRADAYGRTLWTETYGTAGDTFANPELRIRWAAYSGRVVEVGLDGRVYMPVETGSRFGLMFGVPLAFHVGDFLRIDTGVYLPVVFGDPVATTFSVPAYFWFQPSNRFWFGPMAAFRQVDPGPAASRRDLLLGFGFGYQVAEAVDLKWWVLAPRVNDDGVRDLGFGGGFGVQFRIGE